MHACHKLCHQLLVQVFRFSSLHINIYISITSGKVYVHSDFSSPYSTKTCSILLNETMKLIQLLHSDEENYSSKQMKRFTMCMGWKSPYCQRSTIKTFFSSKYSIRKMLGQATDGKEVSSTYIFNKILHRRYRSSAVRE